MRIFSGLDNAEWHFPDSDELSRKLNQRPWEGESSGMVAVKLPDGAWLPDFVESLRQKTFGITGGRSRLEFRFLEHFAAPDSRKPLEFLAAVKTAFELSGSRSTDTSARLARSMLEEWNEENAPILVVIPVFSDNADWMLEQFFMLLDDINKEAANRRSGHDFGLARKMFWLAVGDSRTNFGRWSPYDFASGIPDRVDMFGKGMGPAEMWWKYVVLRIAWETAGSPHLYDLREAEQLPRDTDEEFEEWLNRQAESAFFKLADEMDAEHLAALREWTPQTDRTDSRYDALVARHAFWRPPDETRFQPAPWVARRLLGENGNHPLRPQLCHALVCRPIAEKLISLCLALEASIRLRVNSAPASRETLLSLKSSTDRDANKANKVKKYTEAFYPGCHPALPLRDEEIWSLGDISRALPGDTSLFHHAEKIRLLRNCLAHNHYVSWRTIDEYRHLEKSWRAIL